MTFELSPNQIAGIGATVSGGIGWFLRQLWLRFNASEAQAAREREEAKAEIRFFRQAKEECDKNHASTAIALARVETSLQQMKDCHLAECPFQPSPPTVTPPKRQTTRIHPRSHAA